MPTRLLLLLPLLLILAACADPAAVGSAPDPDPADTPIPVEPDGGIGDGAAAPDPRTSDDAEQGIAEGEPAPGTNPAGSGPEGSTPIPVEPDGGIGDGAGPPPPLDQAPEFGVSSETDSAVVPPHTSCWGVEGSGVCADGRPSGDLVLAADAQLVVTYAEGELTASSSAPIEAGADAPDRQPLPVVQENPGIWLVDVSGLPAGEHGIWLDWIGPQGDAFAALTLRIT